VKYQSPLAWVITQIVLTTVVFLVGGWFGLGFLYLLEVGALAALYFALWFNDWRNNRGDIP
jgi:hypothetical protein